MVKKHPDLKLPPLTDEPGEKRTISPDEPFVQVLDPSTGTATFLVEVIDVIHRILAAKWKQQRLTDPQQRTAWNDLRAEPMTATAETTTADARIATPWLRSRSSSTPSQRTARSRCQPHAMLSAELLAIKSPIRDADTRVRAQDLTFSIKLIDFGLGAVTLGPIVSLASTRIRQLMIAAGYEVTGPELRRPRGWLGSLPEVGKRIKPLAQRRTEARTALDEALMTDEERAKRDAEHLAFRETLKTMDIKMNGTGTGLVAFTDDGDVLDVSAMTAQQRQAFEWFEAAQRR